MSFSSIFALLRKDLKLFFRSKFSAAFTLILPLMIVLFAGFAFNSNSLSNVNLAVYSNSSFGLSQNVLEEIEANNFSLNYYESVDSCIDSVKSGDCQLCMDFSNFGSNESGKILFHVDYSRVNLADTLVGIIEVSIELEEKTISTSRVNEVLFLVEDIKTKLASLEDELREAFSSSLENQKIHNNFTLAQDEIGLLKGKADDLQDSLNENQTDLFEDMNEIKVLIEEIEEIENKVDKDFNELEENQEDLEDSIELLNSILQELSSDINSSEIYEIEKIISPLKTEILPINPDSKSRDFMIPNLFSLISMFGAILLGSTFVLKNKKTRAFFRNFVTPTKGVTFILSMYLASIIILSLQFILVFLGMRYVLLMDNFVVGIEIISTLLLVWTTFIFIGMFIGYVFKNEETTIFSSVIVGSIFMFFSGTLLPLENISSNVLKYVGFNPLVLANSAIKGSMLFNLNFSYLLEEYLILGVISIVFFVMCIVFRNLTKRVL